MHCTEAAPHHPQHPIAQGCPCGWPNHWAGHLPAPQGLPRIDWPEVVALEVCVFGVACAGAFESTLRVLEGLNWVRSRIETGHPLRHNTGRLRSRCRRLSRPPPPHLV